MNMQKFLAEKITSAEDSSHSHADTLGNSFINLILTWHAEKGRNMVEQPITAQKINGDKKGRIFGKWEQMRWCDLPISVTYLRLFSMSKNKTLQLGKSLRFSKFFEHFSSQI